MVRTAIFVLALIIFPALPRRAPAQESPSLTATSKLETFVDGKLLGANLSRIAFSPDGKELLAGGKGIYCWKIESGELLEASNRTTTIYNVGYSKDGKTRLACVPNRRVVVWSVASNKTLSQSQFGVINRNTPGGGTLAVSDSPSITRLTADGKYILTTPVAEYPNPGPLQALNHMLRLYDVRRGGAEVRTFDLRQGRGAYCLGMAADGKRFVAGCGDQTVRLWSLTSGSQLKVYKGHISNVAAVALSPDGKLIASAGGFFPPPVKDKKVLGEFAVRVWDVKSGKQVCQFDGHRSAATALAFTPDSKRIISIDNRVPAGHLWDAATGKEVATFAADFPIALDISPDGRLAATVSASGIVLWRLPEK